MKLLLVDDHPIVRAGLRQLLAAAVPATVSEAADGREALAAIRREPPDLVVLDLNLPGIGGLELLRRLLRLIPALRVLVLSMHAEPHYAARALQAGAKGYVSKSAPPDELLTALRRIAAGGHYVETEIAQALAMQGSGAADPLGSLSERDVEMLRLLAEGRSLTEIAAALGLGYKTVANALSQIKATVGVGSTVDLVRMALAMGIA